MTEEKKKDEGAASSAAPEEQKAPTAAEKKAAKAAEKKAAKAAAQEDDLLAQALEDYGIEDQYVVSSRVDVEKPEVVIVTAGGKKVRWVDGDCLDPLDPVGITGVNPKADTRKPIAGKRKG